MRLSLRKAAFGIALACVAGATATAQYPVDPLAGMVKASGVAPAGHGRTALVELLISGDTAAVRVTKNGPASRRIIPIASPSDVLTLLADRHMQFMWQPLEEWAGPDLGLMRDRTTARLRAAASVGQSQLPPRTTSESTVRPYIRAVIQLANFLNNTGRAAEGEQLLTQQLSSMKFRDGGGWEGIEWFSVAAGIAKSRWVQGDSDGAIDRYLAMEQVMGDSPYAVNATINRASLLASSGRYAEALTAIDAAYARWAPDNREAKIPGSDRQFAWIRACALEGLGRHEEAERAFQPVSANREWADRDFFIEPDAELDLRGRACMKQTRVVTGLLAGQLRDRLFTSTLVSLQPADRPLRDADFWAKIRSDPGLMRLASERMRVLPPEMTPAINNWRDFGAR